MWNFETEYAQLPNRGLFSGQKQSLFLSFHLWSGWSVSAGETFWQVTESGNDDRRYPKWTIPQYLSLSPLSYCVSRVTGHCQSLVNEWSTNKIQPNLTGSPFQLNLLPTRVWMTWHSLAHSFVHLFMLFTYSFHSILSPGNPEWFWMRKIKLRAAISSTRAGTRN